MTTLVVIVLLAGLLFVIIYAVVRQTKRMGELGAVDRVGVGKYVAGLDNADSPHDGVVCAVTPEDFVFLGFAGRELGRIPRDAVNQIQVVDRSQVLQRLTVPRVLLLGVFSLAFPKREKHEEYCVLVDWDDSSGVRRNSVFAFAGPTAAASASSAANGLTKHVKSRREVVRPDEMKCPYCAEVIKKEAKVCRFCNSRLNTR